MIASPARVVPAAPDSRPSVTFVPADASGVARIVIDRPGDPVNAIDVRLMEDLAAAIAAARAAAPRGLVISSGKDGQFVAGADLSLLRGTSQSDIEKASRSMQRALNDLAALPCVTVAAISWPIAARSAIPSSRGTSKRLARSAWLRGRVPATRACRSSPS